MTHYQTYSNGAHFVGSSNQAEENARKALDSANSTRSEKKEGGSSSLSTMSGETMAAFARRLREMEKQLQSIRPEVERKIIQTIQENPKELAEALRGLEANEISLWSENSKRQMNSQNELETLREMMKQTRDGLLEAMKSVNSRMDGLEYRSSGLEKTVSGIGKRLNVISRGYLQGDSASMRNERVALTDGSENNHEGRLVSAHHMVSEFTQHPRVFGGDTKNNGLIGMSNEINLLREALQKEKASKDAFVRDLTNQYNDVHQIVFKNEREYFERLNAQRDEFLKEANFTREQLRKLEETRMNKVIGDSEYMKAMVAQVERKVSDEIQRRVAMDFDNQNFIEQRFKKMKDEIMKGQKKSLSEEFQFINNLKETIGGMNEIIQNTKAQLETSILTTQTMALENVSNLSSALESLKDAAFTRMTANELALNELGQNMSQTMGNLSQFSKKLKEQVESDLASQKTRASEFFSEIEKDWRSLKNQMKAKEQKQEEFNKGAQEETKKLAEAFKSELKKANESSLGQNDSLSKRIEAFRKELEQKEGMFEKLYKHLETQLRTEEQNSQFRLKELGKEMENQIRSQMAGVSEEIMKGDKEVLRIGEEKLKKELRSVEAALKSLEESQKVLWKGDIESARVKLQEKMDIQRKELEEKAKEESARVDQGVAKVKREFDEKVADVRKSIVVEAGKRKEEQNQLAYSINEKIDGTFEGVRNYTREVASDIRNDFDKLMAQVKEKAEIELNGAKEALNRQIEKTKGEVTQAAARGVEAAMDQVEEKLKGVNKRITDLSENTKNAMEQQKRMLLEDIEQRAEQVKSLSKALVTEEIAERLKADENLMQMFNSSISSVKDLFNGLMDQMRSEFLENMSDMDKKFTDLIEEMRNWASKEFEDIRNKAESEQVEREAVGYLDFVYFSLYEDDENRYREHVHKYLKENERESQETVERIGKNAQKIEEKLNENVERLDKKDEEIMGQIERMKNEALREKSDSQKQLEEERNERIEEDKRVMGELRELDKFMTSEVAALDEQLKNTGVELQLDIQSRDYAQRLYNKIFEEDVTKRFLLQRNSLKELELVFDQFEEKTDKNFKVAEKTINSLFRTANHLDAQFYLEYLETRASFADIEQRLRMELGSVSDRMELSVDEIQSKITKILKEEIPLTIGGMSQERQKDQTIIEKRLSQLSENIEKVSNALDSTTSRVSEQENTTSFHEKRIEKNENQIKTLETETYLVQVSSRNSVKLLEEDIRDNLAGLVDFLQEIYDRVIVAGGSSGGGASTIVIDEKIQENLEPLALRLTDLETNLDRKSQQIDNLVEVLEDTRSQIQSTETKISKTRKAALEKEKAQQEAEMLRRQKEEEEEATRLKLIEAENAKKELETRLEFENRRKEEQAEREKQEEELRKKEQEGKSEGEKARLDIDALFAKNRELKEQMENLRSQLEKEKEKSDEMQETLKRSDLERRMKKISEVNIEELQNDLFRFKMMLTELEKDQKERERIKNDLSTKLNEVNGNLEEMRRKMREELENNSKASMRKYQSLNNQLGKMLGSLDKLQKES